MAYDREKTTHDEKSLVADEETKTVEAAEVEDGGEDAEDSGASSFLDRFFVPGDRRPG